MRWLVMSEKKHSATKKQSFREEQIRNHRGGVYQLCSSSLCDLGQFLSLSESDYLSTKEETYNSYFSQLQIN